MIAIIGARWRLFSAILLWFCVSIAGLLLAESVYWLRVFTLALIMAGVAQSWNLMAGFAGQWSLGQLAFFGVGAYGAGVFVEKLDVSLGLGLLFGTLIAGVFAALIGYVALRVTGHFFAVVTFFMVVAMYELVRYFADFTGGQYGLNLPLESGTSVLSLRFESPIAYYYLAMGVAVLTSVAVWAVSRSRRGLLLKAVKNDQEAARALGVRVHGLKVWAMGISGALAGLSGVVYLSVYKLMDAQTAFGISENLDPVVAGILGGQGFVLGGLVGELILQPILAETNSALGSVPGSAALVYGVTLMLVIWVVPRGLLGLLQRRESGEHDE